MNTPPVIETEAIDGAASHRKQADTCQTGHHRKSNEMLSGSGGDSHILINIESLEAEGDDDET
ncbi:hypothetical protein HFO84_13360 [Rhizobium leguminosarum]|uniref:hypothetical protein n=1 Tax=Rhizobium leguminosarum TaxID=384 RepID=UPI00103E98BF|nr:hypothetical protein [Rhizobium leguminosarum]MBY5478317.1 hypothetical protein [Rhizobium leguminosarum]NKK15129.1 hypothetical protein [Rhizobium leguminosarum bv. viciae]TBZ56444.1 hypothetical protein E0H48_18050 [Rhizobium leguminosarum bv. viciae]